MEQLETLAALEPCFKLLLICRAVHYWGLVEDVA